MSRQPATLIIPVETQVRELDAKLLLAAAAAERGLPVILGSRTFINFAMPKLPRGVFLAKSLRALSGLMLKLVRQLGHDIVAWDEESLVRFDSPEYYPWRYSADTFRALDHLFAWGEDDAEFFAAYKHYPGTPIHVTGNPRIDLLRPELRGVFAAETEALRARYGEYILVNTNFSFVNNFVPGLNLIQSRADGPGVERTGRGLSLAFATGMAVHQQAICDSFRSLLGQLGHWFPDRQIVLRPHPSEDHDFWRAVVADSGCDNLHVVHQGNVVPWLLGSRVLLHNGCTTAVEAAVLGTPAVSYQPVSNTEYDYHLPNGLSQRATTTSALRECLGAVLDGGREPVSEPGCAGLLSRHLAATDGPLAADRVVDVLLEQGFGERAPPPPRRLVRLKARVHTNGRTLVKRLNSLRPRHRNSARYHRHRFPEVSAAQLQARIDQFGERLDRFHGISVRPLSRHIFGISGPH